MAGPDRKPLTWLTVLACRAALPRADLNPPKRMALAVLQRCHAAAHGDGCPCDLPTTGRGWDSWRDILKKPWKLRQKRLDEAQRRNNASRLESELRGEFAFDLTRVCVEHDLTLSLSNEIPTAVLEDNEEISHQAL